MEVTVVAQNAMQTPHIVTQRLHWGYIKVMRKSYATFCPHLLTQKLYRDYTWVIHRSYRVQDI